MSYVDAMHDKDANLVRVVERTANGSRVFKNYPAKYQFYYKDPRGKYKSVYDEPLSLVTCKTSQDFAKEKKFHKGAKYESDIKPVFSCLADNYLGQREPNLNIAFFDIEVAMNPDLGYAPPDDPFMEITAISIYLKWLGTLVCLALVPKTLTMEQAEELVKEYPNTMLFDKEDELLDSFLQLIDDADVLSGWNSTAFDIPYTINRVIRILGKEHTKRFCLWNQYPTPRKYEEYGKEKHTYELTGRVHLDSLNLYQNYTYDERHSYRLDAIGEYEIGEHKTVYEGSLDALYNNDFKKFIEYNRQDTMLLEKLDNKLKFINLTSSIAHENTVLLPTTMGAVAVVEQAIINEAHEKGYIIPDRNLHDEELPAAGAYVARPKKGMHKWIGSMDINSLYPSTIRALNMAPETIIGQLRQDYTNKEILEKIKGGASAAGAWDNKFASNEYDMVMAKNKSDLIEIDWSDSTTTQMTGAEIYNMVFNQNTHLMLSANGTLFTTQKEGIIPGLLSKWYSNRKKMQKTLANFIDLERGISIESMLN